MKQNEADGGSRRYILVQLPEVTPEPSTARDFGFHTIADIAKERLRRAGRAMGERDGDLEFNDENYQRDFGFRVLSLTSSNFKAWNATSADATESVASQLKLFADHVVPDRSEQDILYELMLKAGLPLTAPVEQKAIAGLTVYSIAGGLLMICLADEITQDASRGMIELAPQRIVCLDSAFKGNDQLKTNTILEMKSHGIEFRTV